MGSAMGWTVHDVKRASMWEFFAAWNGYVESNTPKGDNKLSEEEAGDLFAWISAGQNGDKKLHTQTYWWDGDWPIAIGVVEFVVSQ